MGCNGRKHEKPWAEFMARQHALRQNFLHAERLDWQLDLGFDLGETAKQE